MAMARLVKEGKRMRKFFDTMPEREAYEEEVWSRVDEVMANENTPFQEMLLIMFTIQTCTNTLDAILDTYEHIEETKMLKSLPCSPDSKDGFQSVMDVFSAMAKGKKR